MKIVFLHIDSCILIHTFLTVLICQCSSEELCLGFEKMPEYKGMLAVAQGKEQHNIRARLGDKDLSVEDQVDCLLDQATDPNILGRVWIGWEPWI